MPWAAAPTRSLQSDAPQGFSWRFAREARIVEVGFGSGHHFPQYAAVHLDGGFLRLNSGPGSDWGSSVLLLPSFWEAGHYHQGGLISVDCRASRSGLTLSYSGRVSALRAYGEVRLREPSAEGISAEVCARTDGHVRLDQRPGEAFKPVFVASMHIANAWWDVESVLVDARRFAIPESGWIVEPATWGHRILLNGGSSSWKRRAPSLEIALGRSMEIAGWKSPSADPSDDNVGIWAATPEVMRVWHYEITVRTS